MKLSKNQVKHVAKLANLPLSEEEEEKYFLQLSKILEYVDQLNKVDTAGIEATLNVTDNKNVLGLDETTLPLAQEEALLNAPRKKDDFFVTKGIFEE